MSEIRDPFTVSPIHRLGAGTKLVALAVVASGIMLLGDWRELVVVLAVALGLYRVAKIPMRQAYQQISPLKWLLVLIFVVQGFIESWDLAAMVVLRIAALALLAMLVTLTTR
ncbi:hypothetical protein [Breoghania sp.]|uniref:hypothetical protein n=1 Tax=Breoghania sp. TaxID=2065378 RepID=UPI0026382511|nr:hypothetical protein [Breoghania sp.]MDJ0930794.1 hypothetical protein [Breoghania sp.]